MKPSFTTILTTICAVAGVTGFTASAIIDGRETKKGELPSTFYLRAQTSDTMADICTGSLITPRLIITAAHCTTKGTKQLYVLNGQNHEQINLYVVEKNIPVETAGVTALSAGGQAHPKFRERGTPDQQFGYDFGYVLLTEDVVGVPTQDYILADAPGTDTTTWIGKHAITSGYGLSSDTGMVAGKRGYKRVGELPITSMTRTYFQVTGNVGNIATGDSGGPVFFEMPGGALAQIGINSAGDEGTSSPGRQGYFTLLRKELLCWAQTESGQKIPGLSCLNAPSERGANDPASTPRASGGRDPRGTMNDPLAPRASSRPRPMAPRPMTPAPRAPEPRGENPRPANPVPRPRAVAPRPRAPEPRGETPRATHPGPRAVTPSPRPPTPAPRAVAPAPRAVTPRDAHPRTTTPPNGPNGNVRPNANSRANGGAIRPHLPHVKLPTVRSIRRRLPKFHL